MLKKIICLLLVVLFISATIVYGTGITETNPATGYEIVIEDDANLLTSADISNLTDIMTSLSEFGNIVLKTTFINSSTAKQYAHDVYYARFGDESGCLFLIDLQNRKIYIHTDGEFRNTITDSKALTITDNIYTYASSGDYGLCAYNAFEQMATLLEGHNIPEPMKYTCAALVAIVCGYLITFMYIFKNSRIQKAPAQEIIDKAVINFDVTNIVSEFAGERRVYSPVSDSSSGSFGGGHSSGGGGHSSHSSHGSGGGGGHSF